MNFPAPPASLLRARRDGEGVSAVEFALVAPLLLVVLAGAIDVTRLIYYQHELTQALRSGVQYALPNPGKTDEARKVILASTSLGTDPALTVSTDQCGCSLTSANPGTWTSCASLTCGSAQREYQQVSATYAWTPILGTVLPLPSPVSETFYLRLK